MSTTETNLNQNPSTSNSAPVKSAFEMGGDGKPDFSSMIPDEWKTKEFVQNALKTENPLESILKQSESAQQLVGKRQEGAVQVPAADAPPEAWAKFAEDVTKPYTLENYAPKPIEWAAEEKELGQKIEQSTPKALLDSMAKSAKANGVTPVQFQKLKSDMDKASLGLHKEAQANYQKALEDWDKDFDTRATSAFGDKKDTVLEGGKKLLDAHVPENLKADLKGLDNRSLVVLAAALGSVATKYIREDSFTTSGTPGSGLSEQSVRDEGRKLMTFSDSKGTPWSDITHPLHDQYVRKVNENFAQLKNIK